MSKIDHNPEFKPDDAKKDWGIDVGNNTSSNKARLIDAEQNPESVDRNESLADRESSAANNVTSLNGQGGEAGWTNSVTNNKATGKAKFANFLKKKGPIGAVLAMLVTTGGIIGVMYIVPSAITFHIINALTDMDPSDDALKIRTHLVLKNKMKNAFAESSDGKCNIKCKLGSVNEDFIKNLKANDFKVDSTKKSFGRYVINSITFPDGTVVNSGAEYSEAMKDTPRASSFKSVFNSKTAYFLNGRFGTILKTKFGLDKTSKLVSDIKDKVSGKMESSKQNVINSLRKALGWPELDVKAPKMTLAEKAAIDPNFKKVYEKVNSINSKTGKFTNLAGGACSIYDATKGISYAIKTARIAAFVAITMTMFTANDQAKAGDGDENIMAVIGDMLTQPDENGDTATSSLGYRMAAYNDIGTLSEEDQKYSSTTTGAFVGFMSTLVGYVAKGGVTSVVGMNEMCKKFASTVASVIEIAVICGSDLMISLVFAAETFGLSILGATAICLAENAIMLYAMNKATSAALGGAVEQIKKTEVSVIDETTRGSALGNSIFSGSAQILGGKSAGYGMKAGNHSQIKKYLAKTAAVRQQDTDIALYEARNTPFDINNQYSFMGILSNNLGLSSLKNSSTTNNLRNLFSFLPKSFATLSNNVSAKDDAKDDLYDNKCQDSSLKSIGVDADAFCNPTYVMSDAELDADIAPVTQYMIDKGYINEDTGEAISGTDYQLFMDNCVNRVDPLGETSASISEDNNYEWKIGLKCVEDDSSSSKTVAYTDTNSTTATDYDSNLNYTVGSSSDLGGKMSYFRVYTMDKSINDTIDTPYAAAGGGTPAGATFDLATVFEPSDQIGCAPGTDDLGVPTGVPDSSAYYEGKPLAIRLCGIPGTQFPDKDEKLIPLQVNSRVSGAVLAMVQKMSADLGQSPVRFEDSYRIYSYQEHLFNTNPNATNPGFSMHQSGTALDFNSGNIPWAEANAGNYGFKQNSGENWHFSPTGG